MPRPDHEEDTDPLTEEEKQRVREDKRMARLCAVSERIVKFKTTFRVRSAVFQTEIMILDKFPDLMEKEIAVPNLPRSRTKKLKAVRRKIQFKIPKSDTFERILPDSYKRIGNYVNLQASLEMTKNLNQRINADHEDRKRFIERALMRLNNELPGYSNMRRVIDCDMPTSTPPDRAQVQLVFLTLLYNSGLHMRVAQLIQRELQRIHDDPEESIRLIENHGTYCKRTREVIEERIPKEARESAELIHAELMAAAGWPQTPSFIWNLSNLPKRNGCFRIACEFTPSGEQGTMKFDQSAAQEASRQAEQQAEQAEPQVERHKRWCPWCKRRASKHD